MDWVTNEVRKQASPQRCNLTASLKSLLLFAAAPLGSGDEDLGILGLLLSPPQVLLDIPPIVVTTFTIAVATMLNPQFCPDICPMSTTYSQQRVGFL